MKKLTNGQQILVLGLYICKYNLAFIALTNMFMSKYQSSSRYHIFEGIATSGIFIVIGYAGINATKNIAAQISVVAVVVLLLVCIILYVNNKTIDINFNEQYILVTYIFKGEKETIRYENLTELIYIYVAKVPTTNRLKFNHGSKVRSIKFDTVANGDEFINFVKWIKSKNDKIKVDAFPSDHYMNHRLQEVYGFKYRKVIKVDK